jgi:hypothetical protein
MWIRGPAWDGAWILSGVPIGLTLVILAPTISLTFVLMVLLEHGHTLSPMALAWNHMGFREVMQRNTTKYVVFPIVIVLATTALGAVTALFVDLHVGIGLTMRIYEVGDFEQPFVIMVVLYWLWNRYHFGIQNFGVLSIYRRISGSGRRATDKAYCLLVQSAVMFLIIAPRFELDRNVTRDICVILALVGPLVPCRSGSACRPARGKPAARHRR